MCYSAQITADCSKVPRHRGAVMSLEEFARLWIRQNGLERRKIPKGLRDQMQAVLPADVADPMAGSSLRTNRLGRRSCSSSCGKADNERVYIEQHRQFIVNGLATRADKVLEKYQALREHHNFRTDGRFTGKTLLIP